MYIQYKERYPQLFEELFRWLAEIGGKVFSR